MTDRLTIGDATLIRGDCQQVLATLPERSVHTCVTSPPYYGLRDYGVDGQIGLEASPWEFIDRMVEVFRAVRRVLRDDGTVWLNLGDSYASNGGAGWQGENGQRANRRFTAPNYHRDVPRHAESIGFKPKDLMGIPWRVALALQDDGWYLRRDIIWHKPNPMPESCQDRPTTAHEYIFLLSKQGRYYYDAEASAEARKSSDDRGVSGWASGDTPHNAVAHARDKGDAKTFRGGQYTNGNKFDNSHSVARDSHGNKPATKATRNRRSVWTVASEPFPGSHFATFPAALIPPCILAGAPPGGTVLDPFAGTATTGAVALRHGRRFVGVELSGKYIHELAVPRLTEAARQRRLFA